MIRRIYADGSYSEGDDVLGQVQYEIDLPEGADLPEPWSSAKRDQESPKSVADLAEEGKREDLGALAERVRGTDAEAGVLRAIRAEIEERLAVIEGGGK